MATDLGVTRACARSWIVRGRIPDRHWPTLIVVCRKRFGRRLSQMRLAAAYVSAKGAPARKFPAVELYMRHREAA